MNRSARCWWSDLHPLEQRNELVFFARQARLDVVMLMQKTAHVVGDFQHDVFFLRAFVADRAGVDAAVTGSIITSLPPAGFAAGLLC